MLLIHDLGGPSQLSLITRNESNISALNKCVTSDNEQIL